MGEITLTVNKGGFFTQFIKIAQFVQNDCWQVFEVSLTEPIAVIQLKPFLGALGPILTENLVILQVWLTIGLGDLTSVFPVEFYSK